MHALTPHRSASLYLQFLARCHPYILLCIMYGTSFSRSHFYQFGEINSIHIASAQKCAFVNFTTRQAAEQAARGSFNKLVLKGDTNPVHTVHLTYTYYTHQMTAQQYTCTIQNPGFYTCTIKLSILFRVSVGCRLKILWGKSQATPIGGQGKAEGRSLPPVPGLPAGECVCIYLVVYIR